MERQSVKSKLAFLADALGGFASGSIVCEGECGCECKCWCECECECVRPPSLALRYFARLTSNNKHQGNEDVIGTEIEMGIRRGIEMETRTGRRLGSRAKLGHHGGGQRWQRVRRGRLDDSNRQFNSK